MNRKGEIGLGVILIMFIGVLVGIVLLPAIADNIGTTRNIVTADNSTYTAGAVSVAIDLTGQELFGTPVVTNYTGGEIVPTANYTLDEGISATTGLKTVRYTSGAITEYAGQLINISYQYGMDGYIDSGGGRSIALLVVIFAALGIAIVALYPTLKDNLSGMLKGT